MSLVPDPPPPVSTGIANIVPEMLKGMTFFGLEAWQWIGLAVAIVGALMLGWTAAAIFTRVGKKVAAHTVASWDDDLVGATRRPIRVLLAIVAFRVLIELLAMPPNATLVLARCEGIALAFAGAWLVIALVRVIGEAIERRATATSEQSSEAARYARGVQTQVRVMRRVINFLVGIVAVALTLTQFEVVRSIGFSLLASAGIAGVVLGLAAQKTLAGLFAGIQISATQPIRIGDVVVVEGEWGTIEEITLTFVVVKVWDERRLVVPVTRFLDQPFCNWTLTSPELLGTIFLYVDWRFPVAAMRAELDRILRAHPAWDGRAQGVVVTDAKERTLEVRALVSAADASKLWDLRVDVREQLVTWLQALEGGKYLPRVRVDEDPHAAAIAPSSGAAIE